MVVALAAAPATAQEPTADPSEVAPIDTPDIDPVLDGLEVDVGPAITRAERELLRRLQDRDTATVAWVAAEQERAAMAARSGTAAQVAAEAQRTLADRVLAQATLTARVDELDQEEALLKAALATEQDLLRGMAAEAFAGPPEDEYAVLGSMLDWTEADRREAVRDRAVDLQSDAVETARAPWEAVRAERRRTNGDLDDATEATADAQAEVVRAVDERDRFDELLAVYADRSHAARAVMDRTAEASRKAMIDRRSVRLEAQVVGQDLSLVAVHAYWRASQLAPCQIPWWVLAGVGRTETHHGTAQGAYVTASGDTSKHILGIPLDGRPGVAAIADTDGGLLDDDPTWDRAVGPMQFIPGTWMRWAADGNGDGKTDPHNLYDTALAAARYLCFGRGPLLDDGAIRGALLSYNRSVLYGTKVLEYGHAYRDGLDLPDPFAPADAGEEAPNDPTDDGG